MSEYIHQSDATILMTVENLIARAMGPPDENKVDFKIIQELLVIFARQLRMLEHHVELKHGLDAEFDSADWKKDKLPEGDKDHKKDKRTVSLKKGGDGKSEDAKKLPKDGENLKVKSNVKDEGETEDKGGTGRDGQAGSGAPAGGKTPGQPSGRRRVGSIEVVSGSEFDLLAAAVKKLQSVASPGRLPTNEQLTSDIQAGKVSLDEALDAKQITARVQATEDSVARMVDLLTKLALSGALPADMASKIQELLSSEAGAGAGTGASQAVLSVMPPGKLPEDGVTRDEMEEAINNLQSNLKKVMNDFMTKALVAAEKANNNTMEIRDKMGDTLEMAPKINEIKDLISDYVEQLRGLEEAIRGQADLCADQVTEMQEELNKGLAVFQGPVPNAETVAVLELTDRYNGLMSQTEAVIFENAVQTETQNRLTESYGELNEAINILREEKADREEVQDALRDKASKALLQGMMMEKDFQRAKELLEGRLDKCFDKFQRQGEVWEEALADLKEELDTKALVLQLTRLREEAVQRLRSLDEAIQCLALAVGEPYAALITKELNLGAACATCQGPAKMRVSEPTYDLPPLQPEFKPPPGPAGEDPGLCIRGVLTARPPDPRTHSCLRWAGGSHTLLTRAVARQRAPDLPPQPPYRQYEAYGDDGKMYRMQEECQPCEECLVVSAPTAADGAGDTAQADNAELNLNCETEQCKQEDDDKKAGNENERKSGTQN
ncbi:uncharacterized protein LOC105392334 [Plutella xylostella]|uniref:uncharacterized protein LOC105392334 n=1 Tax=Plutella xylostella TaxID=51655 RepID=UPI0020330FC0|nr:uncharacterized protein LOC105392334 [Plutella xylostella]